jgi:outer membrane protein TolC
VHGPGCLHDGSGLRTPAGGTARPLAGCEAVAGNAIDQDAAWWAGFDDPLLGQLAHQVLAANLDLQLAANRVQQSRAARGITAADRLPSVSASASGVRARNSEVG